MTNARHRLAFMGETMFPPMCPLLPESVGNLPVPHTPPRSSAKGRPMSFYRVAIVLFSIAFVVIGFALLVRTAMEGGGVVGFVLGALFIVLGVGRLVVERKRGG